jgi:predicted HTH transcriptional regulator
MIHAALGSENGNSTSNYTAAAIHQHKKRNNAPKLPSTISSKSDRIIQWLEKHGPSSGSEMALGMGLARKSLHFYLKRLVDLRKVSLSGLGRNAVYVLNANSELHDMQ